MNAWNVLTAGPSAGKTSTINYLSAKGYATVPEAARLYTDIQASHGVDEDDLVPADFQQDVIELDRQMEENAPDDEPVFFDRSLADNIAYARYFGDTELKGLKAEVRDRYDNVFVLEQLPFEEDYARNEDTQESVEIHEELERTYEALGYDVVSVPVMSIEERVDIILNYL